MTGKRWTPLFNLFARSFKTYRVLKYGLAATLFLFSYGSLADSNTTEAHELSVVEMPEYWFVSLQDNLEFSSPDFDHSKWNKVSLPADLWSQSAVWSPDKSIGWARTHIKIQEQHRDVDLALYLGSIWEAAEIFFNGEKIEQFGSLSEAVNRSYAANGPQPVVAGLPARLIRYEQSNLLAVRFQSGWNRLGPVQGPVFLGTKKTATDLAEKETAKLIMLELLWLLVAFVCIVLLLLADSALGRPWRHFYYMVGIVCIAITLLLSYSTLGNIAGWLWQGSYLSSLLFSWFAVACCFLHVAQACRGGHNTLDYCLAAITCAYAVVEQWLVTQGSWYQYQMLIGMPLFIVITGLLIWYAIRSYKLGGEERLTSIMVIILAVVILADLIKVELLPGMIGEYLAELLLLLWVLITLAMVATECMLRMREREWFARDLLHSQEQERKRVANELHDSLGQQLAAISWQVESLKQSQGSQKNDIVSNLRAAMDDVHRIIRDLRPELVEGLGLAGAFCWLGDELSKSKVTVTTDLCAQVGEIPEQLSGQFFRIVQEALHNAVKHGGANEITISLTRTGKRWILTINDNGKGFDMSKLSERSGLGVIAMQERARACGGSLDIRSKLAQGCSVQVALPLAG
ncbi:MAG: ATP-binding protein [Arenicella sp.]